VDPEPNDAFLRDRDRGVDVVHRLEEPTECALQLGSGGRGLPTHDGTKLAKLVRQAPSDRAYLQLCWSIALTKDVAEVLRKNLG
jgi:hypothetical protein